MDEMGGLSPPMSSRTSPDWVPVLSFRGEDGHKVTPYPIRDVNSRKSGAKLDVNRT